MKLYCNGFNLFGQLNVNKPIVEEFIKVFEFEVIKQVCINQSYTVIATNKDWLLFQKDRVSYINKEIILLDSNDETIIFLDNRGKLLKSALSDFFSEQDFFNVDTKKLVDIKSGSKLIVAYFSDGVIYNIPQKLQFNHNDIVDIQCGKEHCLLLDTSGNIYSFGKGSHGQLGLGKLDEELEPQLVEALAGIKIKKIAAGGWHSCAISKEGDLYVWGWNSNGQLGLGKDEQDKNFIAVMASPQVVDFCDENLNALFVACGSRHTIVFLDNKQLYGCGWNKYHQLTKSIEKNYFKLTHLHDFLDEEVINIHCGPWNSAVQCK